MNYREVVDDYIRRFGEMVKTELVPLDAEGYTSVSRGTATVGINVLDDRGVLVLLSPIMNVPQRDNLSLYTKLLELNFLETSDAAFAIDAAQGIVYLRALRRLEGLDFGEFVDLLDAVASTADEWDERLRAEFGP